MDGWELVAVLIIVLALLGAKESIKCWRAPGNHETARRVFHLGLMLIVLGLAWYFGLRTR